MKRILSLILALAVTVSAFTFTVFAEGEQTDSYADKVELLKLAGIVDSKFTVTDSKVSRGQLTSFLVRSNGMSEFLGQYNTKPFIDVDGSAPFSKEIMVAKDMGLISGYSDGSFRPENTVTVLEAAICFIRLLGYDVKAEAIGGYPAGYYQIIKDTGLLKGVNLSYNEELTVKEAVTIIFNALHTKMFLKTGFGDEISYGTKDGYTLLYNAFKIEYVDGIVEGIDLTNLFGENDLPNYHIYVGDEAYYTAYDMYDTLGYYVRAYIREEMGGDTVILAIKEETKNEEEIVKIKDIVDITGTNLVSEDINGKQTKYGIEKNAPVIFNGTNTKSSFNMNLLKKDDRLLSGTVKLLDNDKDSKADVIFVDAYENMIAGRVNPDTFVVYDYYDAKIKYDLDTAEDDPYVLIYDEEGKLMETADIPNGASLTVYQSKADAWQKFIKVYVSTKTVTGVITEITDEAGTLTAVIDGKSYVVSDYAIKNSFNIITGRAVDVVLNHFGEIAKLTYSNDDGKYQYAMVVSSKMQSGFEGKYLIKFMDEQGGYFTSQLAAKFTLDGNKLSSLNQTHLRQLENALRDATLAITGTQFDNYYYQLVKYGINKDGEINYIDTVMDVNGDLMAGEDSELDNELYVTVVTDSSCDYYNSTNMIAQRVIVENNASVFLYPEKKNAQNEKFYDVRGKNFFVNDTDYYGVAFFKDTTEGFEANKFMYKFSAATIEGDLPSLKAYIVTKVTECLDADGDIKNKWYMYNGGTEYVHLVDKTLESATTVADEKVTADKVKEGDIIYFTVNSVTDEIEAFLPMYSTKDKKAYNTTKTNNVIEPIQIVKSTSRGIKYIYNSAIGYTQGGTFVPTVDGSGNPVITGKTDLTPALVFNNIHNASAITVYNATKSMARPATFQDLIGYLDNNDDYDREAYVRWYHPSTRIVREIIIIKR